MHAVLRPVPGHIPRTMIEIRTADDPASLDAVRALVRAHILAHSAVHDDAAAERVVAALPAPYVAPRGALWAAWDGDAAVGCVALHELAPDVAELKRMYVAPEARGRGALRALCEAAAGWARAHGLHTLELGVMEANAGARAAYAAAGFAERDREEVRRGGRLLVHVRMTRPVS